MEVGREKIMICFGGMSIVDVNKEEAWLEKSEEESEKVTFLKPWQWSVQFSCSVVSDSLRPHELQHTRPPCPSPTPGVHSDSRPLSQWCHPAISSSVVPFSSCPQSLPASESFPMSQLHFFRVSYQSFIHFLGSCHVFLTSLICICAHLSKLSPLSCSDSVV